VPSESAERIFEAATRLFGERGYPSTSMRDIGEASACWPREAPGTGRGPGEVQLQPSAAIVNPP